MAMQFRRVEGRVSNLKCEKFAKPLFCSAGIFVRGYPIEVETTP